MTVTTADPIKTTMAPKSTTKTKKKKKTAKKKRNISKHILLANKEREALEKARKTDPFASVVSADTDSEPATTTTAAAAAASSSKKLSSSPNSNTKDIKEAAGYLTNWKNYRQQWKFNKNTQSWLIRHMYEADKVAKGTFTIIIEYLQGLEGNGNKQRVLQDATRRALRYRQYSEEKEGVGDGIAGNKNSNTKVVQFAKDTKDAVADDSAARKKGDGKGATEEERRWNALCDHDKRKEYKRARKILETLQTPA